ncbi:MAG: hypothetical protein GC190_04550 [Alphaproteobacteria bacterium]|nr:hypothetical protein [Alphaproteobacteria bacterium]
MTTDRLRSAVDRTLLLMRDELVAEASDSALLEALTGNEIALVADKTNLKSHSAQVAFVTSAIVLARSGHRVTLLAPDLELRQSSSPLRLGTLVGALVELGTDLLPGVEFETGAPKSKVDLEIRFGDTPPAVAARSSFAVQADAWRARLASRADQWGASIDVPFGGMAAGGAAAAEAFKITMRRLRHFALNPATFDTFFAPAQTLNMAIAPPDVPLPRDLGEFELVSGGAIGHASLFAISRILNVSAHARVFDDDRYAISNLNRYMLTRLSDLGEWKVWHLSRQRLGRMRLEPVPERFQSETALSRGFDSRVLVGADDIPTRWEAQRRQPKWLGVGATTHWSAMASAHPHGGACAACLHPQDDPTVGPIPTVAFVSFWAGLMLATYFVRELVGVPASGQEQQTFLTPFRLERVWRSSVPHHRNCPLGPHVRRVA